MRANSTIAFFLVLLALTSVSFATDVPFAGPDFLPGSTSVGDLAIAADLDGDGDLDTVIAPGLGSTAPEMVWFENNRGPSNSWIRRVISPSNAWVSVGSADIDGDGDVDVFAATETDVAWFENDGGSPPSWTERGISSGESLVSSVEAADLGRDGDLDLLVATGGNAGEVLWFESNGAAIPGWTRQLVIDGSDFTTATAADLDSDGDLDVLVAGAQNTGGTPGLVQTIRNDGGGGAWAPLTAVLPPNRVRSLAVGDIDGDGDIDAAIAAPDVGGGGTATLLWLDNDGSGEWSANDAANPGQPVAVELLDLDMDGDQDLIYGAAGAGGVAWLPNSTGLGNFGPASAIASGTLADVELGDVDRDGDIDVLASADYIAWVDNRTIHRNAVFPVPSVITTTGGGTANSVFAADVDGDGDLDALTAGADTFAWDENDGASPPSWTQRTIAATGGGTANAVFAADVDGDGDLDALTAGADTFAWHENDGATPPIWTERTITTIGGTANAVFAADVDGDGDLDALTAGADTFAWHENTGSAINVVNPDFELLYKEGSNTVTSPLFPNFAAAAGQTHLGLPGPTVTFSDGSTGNLFDMAGWQWSTTAPAFLAVSNVNSAFFAGHKRDMVLITNGVLFSGGTVARTASQVLTTSLEQGVTYTLTADFGWRTDNTAPTLPPVLELYAGGTLLTPTASSSPALIKGEWVTHSRTYLVTNPAISGPLEIEIGLGANTDGRQLNIDHVTLRKNDAWTQRTIATTGGGSANAVYAADIDGDGDVDVLTAGADTFAWHENDGASPPSWTQRTIATTGGGDANSVLAVDVDGDGDVDALTAGADTFAWQENDGASPPSWTQRTIATTGGGTANSVFAADVDHDGDLDVLTAWAGTIAWHENDGDPVPSWTQRTIATTGGTANSVFAGDMDRDGDVDALSARADTFAWHENRGGQFGNTAAACFSGPIREGEEAPLVSVDLKLNGRPGDSPGRLADSLFDLGLQPVDLSTVLETLRLYRDNGDLEFNAADVLLETFDVATFAGGVGGIYDLQYPADPSGIVTSPARYFLTGQVTSNASSSGFANLNVTNFDGGTALIDANAGIILSEEDDGLSTSCSESRPILRTQVVNDTSDAVDANPGDGTCDTGSGFCTLRAAIMEANSSPGADSISLGAGTYQLTIVGNDDTGLAGDLDILDDLTLDGSGAGTTIIDGQLLGNRLLHAIGAVTVAISDLTVTNGSTGADGGGLLVGPGATLELNRCVVEANSAGTVGGGISAEAGSSVQVAESRIVGNFATGNGGGIHNLGTANLLRSEISDNTGSDGGGAWNAGVAAAMSLDSCTVSGNTSNTGEGGGAGTDGSATLSLTHTTVAANSGFGLSGFGGVTSYNSIIADNSPWDCNDLVTSNGYTLIEDEGGGVSSCAVNPGAGDLGGDPMLSPLGDYGGTTQTHRLFASSPAIDAGSCGGAASERDQTGQARPVDDPDAANAVDGCDIGAYEARIGQTQPPIEIPIRWCGVRGAPSVQNPSLVGQNTVNDVLRSRHETASDEIYLPQAGIVLRSGGNFIIEDYPILDAPACVETSPDVFTCDDAREAGDVVLDLDTGDFSEFHDLVAACRVAWEALDPNITGITAVHINSFIDPAGDLLDIIGVGGRAPFGDAVEQSVAGRVMVVDNFYRIAANPADTNERLFGHEMGHALSLLHGNGVDDNLDLLLDNNDERPLPRFDGPNLMQYRDGDALTPLQALQMRIHALVALPGAGLAQFSDSVAAGTPIDEETEEILQWGFRALLELEQEEILQFEQDEILQFEQEEILQWEQGEILQWEQDEILQWEQEEILQWEQEEILQFGATFSGSAPTDPTTFHISLAELPWPASVRPDSRLYFYLDLDVSDNTGAYPAFFPIPGDSPNNFPGLNNLAGEPPIGDEAGVDIILEVTLTSDCASGVCSSFATLKAFDFNDTIQAYESILTTLQLDLTAYGLGLYRDNGGAEPDVDDVPVGITIRVAVPNSLLFAAGWGFQTGPNGPVPNPIAMETASTVECSGGVLNTDPFSASADCSCATCNECGPDYPGCGLDDPEPKEPRILNGSRIVTDHDSGSLTFEPPILPRAVVAPVVAEEGQTVTVYVLDLPTDVTGQVEVSLSGVVLGTVPTSAIDAGGEVSLTVPLPFGLLGEQTLSSGITGFAPRATTRVTITASLDFPDNDGDGIDDATDPDDDNDGVSDGNDSDPLNPFVCSDTDSDTCDDCNSGSLAPLDDGPDFDLDGQCNAGDPDDDNDGVLDVLDGEPLNPNACGDIDNDLCDDCSVVSNVPSPNNDGPDLDGDGICDISDAFALGPITAPIDPLPVGSTIIASASFTDSNGGTHSAEWDWGDGTITIGTVTETDGAGDVGDDHTYTVPGVYRVRLTVTADDISSSGTSEFQFVVIFDPSGGFVTGGGWIDSPAGAYVPDPWLIGRAHFGFVSKYKKGASTPTGTTEFEFAVADLLFESTDYDWLVIAGHKAQFKGSGKINGLGSYGFLLSAIDEKLTPSTDDDLFRIKIWDKDAADTVVYDNLIGGSDDDDPTTALGGGSIVIHKKK